ncbi:MAG: MBL fold metallo-hydrolase [Dehalococcoidia bacterium]|nr:MAG: MBL fold metallo-hydrolase [Dehalococcoidia bacterium]
MPDFDVTTLEPPREIVPGLWRLRTPMTSDALPWIMPYAFAGKHGVTLFDSGYGTPEAQVALTAQLKAIGYGPADVQRLIVSHAHPDHLGLAGWLKEQSPACEVTMLGREVSWFKDSHRGDEDWMKRSGQWMQRHGVTAEELERGRQDERGGPPWERQQREEARAARAAAKAAAVAEGKHPDAATETERRSWHMRIEADRHLVDGELLEFDGWQVMAVWTPGHTPGHLCAYIPEHRLTFTGDHVLSRITPNVSLSEEDEAAGRNPLREFLASLKKVSDLDTGLALPAHEETIDDLPARCQVIAEHHEHRLHKALDAIDGIGGQPTAAQIAERVTWNRPYSTFSMMKRRSAIGETLAHLDLLREDTRVLMHEAEDGTIRWERAR